MCIKLDENDIEIEYQKQIIINLFTSRKHETFTQLPKDTLL